MKLKNIIRIVLMIIAVLFVANINVFAKTVVVDTDTLKFRTKPSTDEDSKTIQLLDLGQKLEYIDEEDGFYKVRLNGTTGYVSKDYTKLVEDSNTEKTEESATDTEATNETTTETKEVETEKKETTENEKETEPVETIGAIDEPQEIVATEMKVKNNSKIYILPVINANIIEEIEKDTTVKIIATTNGWTYVETENVMGCIRKSNLEDTCVVSDDIEEVENTETEETTKNEEKKEN